MKNYLMLNDKRIDLTDAQVREIEQSFNFNRIRLSEVAVGETFKIEDREFVVLEHKEGTTAIILKGLLPEMSTFGENNNFADDGCVIREKLVEFASKIGAIVGEDNLLEHSVDLTSDDGREDYGTVKAKMSILTCELYRKFVRILDKYDPKEWWWLVTPYSTPTHGDSSWIKCVSPTGGILNGNYDVNRGVRPFCILKSNIFVSK